MTRFFQVTAFLASSGISLAAQADQHVKLADLPAAVRQTVERETKGGTIKDIERDVEKGTTTYEIEYSKDGVRWELDVAADGTVLKRHKD